MHPFPTVAEPGVGGVRKGPSAPLQKKKGRNLLGEAGDGGCGLVTGQSQLMAKSHRKRQTCLCASLRFPAASAAPPLTWSWFFGGSTGNYSLLGVKELFLSSPSLEAQRRAGVGPAGRRCRRRAQCMGAM